MKKTAVVLLLFVFVMSAVLTGCVGGVTTEGKKGTEQTQSAKPVELDILTCGDTWDPNNAFLPIIEEITNTKLNMQVVPVEDYESKRNVVMASGKLPNVIRIRYQDPMYLMYVQDGMLLPLDDMLDMHPAVKNAFANDIWEDNRAPDGKIYHFPRVDEETLPNLLMLRKDVLDELNLPIPETPEELRNVFKTLKEQNPDKGYTPFVGNRNELIDIDPFFYAFGTGYCIWQQSDTDPDKIVFSTTTEKFKESLKFIRDLRRDGLFEAEWYVGKERGIDKFYLGQSEFTMDSPQYVEYRISEVLNVDEDAVIDYIPYFKGKDGKIYGAKLLKNDQSDPGAALTKNNTTEQIEAFFNLLAWFYSDEGVTMLRYGVEGKTYDIIDGKIVAKLRGDNPPEYDMENMDRFDFAYTPAYRNFIREVVPDVVSDEQFNIARKAIEATFKYPIIDYGSNLNDEVIYNNLNTLKSLTDELITKAILSPDVDIDKLFEEYQQKLKENKLNEVTEAINRLNKIK